jgi:hypothetical protein
MAVSDSGATSGQAGENAGTTIRRDVGQVETETIPAVGAAPFG